MYILDTLYSLVKAFTKDKQLVLPTMKGKSINVNLCSTLRPSVADSLVMIVRSNDIRV